MPIRSLERSDRGASAIEYAALIVLAALILGALVPLIPGKVGATLPGALCRLLNISEPAACAGASPGKKKIDINPAWCVSREQSAESSTEMSYPIFGLATLNFGNGVKEIRYDSREEDFDGKVKHYVYMMFINKNDVGLSLNAGDANKGINIGGGMTARYGDLYRLTPAQYQKLSKVIDSYAQDGPVEQVSGPWGTLGRSLVHWFNGDDSVNLPQPQITFNSIAWEGKAKVALPIKLDTKLTARAKYALPNGIALDTKHGHEVHTEHWYLYKDDKGHVLPATATYNISSGSYTFTVDRDAGKTGKSGRGVTGDVSGSFTGTYSLTTRITRDDKTGKLRGIRYAITYGDAVSGTGSGDITGKKPEKGQGQTSFGYSNSHGTGKTHTEVVQVPFDLNDAKSQQIGENWLKNHGVEMPPEVAREIFPNTSRWPVVPIGGSSHGAPLKWLAVPTQKASAGAPPANADPFEKMFYNTAAGWKTDATTADTQQDINLTLPIGRGLGITSSMSTQDAKTTHAEILDAPGADGRRQWINYPDCTAVGNH